MFYDSCEIDEDLKCSFCTTKFSSVIKLLPDCGESICGDCYEDLKPDLAESSEFECLACRETHRMPTCGLTDNKGLLRILQRRKKEKPLSEQARKLKPLVKSIQSQMTALRAFDGRDHIDQHCDELELQVREAIESAVKTLNAIEDELLKEIDEYRTRCRENFESGDELGKEVGDELEALVRETDAFNDKWSSFFNLVDVLESDSAIESALNATKDYDERIRSMENRLKSASFKDEILGFKPDQSSLSDKKRLKQHFNLVLEQVAVSVVYLQGPPALKGHSGNVNQLAFLPDENLASCADDGKIKVWSLTDNEELYELTGHTNRVFSIATLGNGQLASASADCTIKLWDLKLRKEARTLTGHAGPVIALFNMKSGYFASYSLDNTIKVWNPYSLVTVPHSTITGHGNTSSVSQIFTGLLNNNLLACSVHQSLLNIWNPMDAKLVKSITTGDKVTSRVLAISNDQVAVGFHCGTIKVVDLTDDLKSVVKEYAHKGRVSSLVLFPGGKLASCSEDGASSHEIKIWSIPDLQLLQTMSTDHKGVIDSLVVSPDERFLATGSRDSTVKLWPIKA